MRFGVDLRGARLGCFRPGGTRLDQLRFRRRTIILVGGARWALGTVDALGEQLGQVNGRWHGGRLRLLTSTRLWNAVQLTGFCFALDEPLQIAAVFVLVFLRLELRDHTVDQSLGHAQLFWSNADRLQVRARQVETLRVMQFIRETQEQEHKGVFECHHGGQVLTLSDNHFTDAGLTGATQYLPQQRVRLFSRLLRGQIVGPVEIAGIDLAQLDAIQDVDLARRLYVGLGHIFFGEDDELAFAVLVTFDNVLPRDLFARLLVHMFVADRRKVSLVEHRHL